MNPDPRTPSSGQGDPPFSIAGLTSRCMGSPAVVRLVLDRFEQQLDSDLSTLERLLASHSATEIARVAHALKGAAGAVGADGITRTAAEIESLAHSSQLSHIADQLSALREQVHACIGYLPTARATLPAGPKPPEAQP